MSETSEPSTIPDHWAHTPPAPRETRYLCLLDGTTIEGSDARRRHDEHFHAKTEEGRAEPYVDEAMLRREALSEAARVARGDETPQQLVERAQAFEAFLRGDPVAAVTRAPAVGGAPTQVHEALDRAWSQVGEGHGHPLHRDQADEDDLVEVLQQLPGEDLARVVEVLQIVRAVAFGVKVER